MSVTPAINLIAYTCTPEKVFVKVPNERGRWMLTDRCVVEVACTHCGAARGEPCFRHFGIGQRGIPSEWMEQRRYGVGTHHVRRTDYQRQAGHGHARRHPEGAKPRVRAADILESREPA